MNYNKKKFRLVTNSENGEISKEIIFQYHQNGNIVTSEYAGGKIIAGHLIGLITDDGKINIRYHQINVENELMTGTCLSTPEILPNGKIRLYETWKWTSGDKSQGTSIIEEI